MMRGMVESDAWGEVPNGEYEVGVGIMYFSAAP